MDGKIDKHCGEQKNSMIINLWHLSNLECIKEGVINSVLANLIDKSQYRKLS